MGLPSVNGGSIERADLDGSNRLTIGVSVLLRGDRRD
jgi:hypothetical protein